MPKPSLKELLIGKYADGSDVESKYMDLVAVRVSDVRSNLRDFPQLNEISERDLEDHEYVNCIVDAIAEFNRMMPFFSSYGPTDFPDRKLLQDMAVVEALERLILWHARNQFSASDTGLEVPVHEQWQPLKVICDGMEAKAQDSAKKLKTMLNIQRGWGGGVGSPIGFGW